MDFTSVGIGETGNHRMYLFAISVPVDSRRYFNWICLRFHRKRSKTVMRTKWELTKQSGQFCG